jgi:subtilase family serine protease
MVRLAMNITNPSHAAKVGPKVVYRSPRRNRPSLICESLEHRQLLSANAAVTSATQVTAQPSLDVIPLVSTGPAGYSPQQIQTAYGVQEIKFSGGTVTGNGAGETIAIVDAYSDPNIASDLAKFDSEYGLSAPPSFTVKNLGGTTTNAGWALEESLDVEWAHAIAPAANIVLVEAANSSLNSLFNAVSYASKLPGVGVVSMSWGTQEFWGESQYDSLFTTPAGHTGVTYVASSGDAGAWYGPMYPSVSPNVLAVGGTSLTLNSNGTYSSETGWSDSTGGFSGLDMNWWYYEPAPSYQVAAQASVGLNYGVRTTPDVSFNADPNTGVAVYDSVSYSGQSGWFEVGGTSAAAPAWAGLVAITDQGLATGGKGTLTSTQTLTDLYSLPSSDFHDITTGFNGYSATPGYDLVTGLGTPKSNLVVAGLLSASGVSSSSVTTQAVAAVTSSSDSTSSHHVSASVSTTTTATTQVETVASSLPVQVVGVLQTQTTNTGNAASNAQGIQQTSTTTTTVNSSATTAPSLGQSVSQPLTTSDRVTEDNSQPIIQVNDLEPVMPPAPVSEAPTDPAPVPDAARPKGPEPGPATAPAAPALPIESMPDRAPTLFDAALEAIGNGWSTPRSERSNEPRVVVPELPAEEPQPASSTPSTLAGTTAVAAAGVYWFTLQQTDRKKSRWMPGRN